MVKINKFFVPYILLLIVLGYSGKIFISFIFVIIHELTHYVVSCFYGLSTAEVEILPIGLVLKLKDLDEAEPEEDLIISMSGPLINLILAFMFYKINCYELFLTNLALGIFNFIPALPLDGGRILRDILSLRLLYKKADKITINCSICFGVIFIFYDIFLFIKNDLNFSIGVLALFIIFCSFKEKERIVYIIMGDIIKKRYKFLKKGYIENKSTSIYYKKDLLSILSIVDKNKYSLFIVLNDDMESIDILYEREIIEGLKQYGNITVDELIKSRLK